MKYLLLFLIGIGSFASITKNDDAQAYSASVEQRDAYKVLSNKCNVCHIKRNPRKVFTLENMDRFARKINRQVFIWKRMPKGNEISLSEQEKKTIQKWLNNQLKK